MLVTFQLHKHHSAVLIEHFKHISCAQNMPVWVSVPINDYRKCNYFTITFSFFLGCLCKPFEFPLISNLPVPLSKSFPDIVSRYISNISADIDRNFDRRLIPISLRELEKSTRSFTKFICKWLKKVKANAENLWNGCQQPQVFFCK